MKQGLHAIFVGFVEAIIRNNPSITIQKIVIDQVMTHVKARLTLLVSPG